MVNQFSRTELLVGAEAIERYRQARVAVFGVGGVGGYVVEALARSGIGTLDLIDNDTVSLTNINRQIIALHSTIGQYKVDVAKARVKDICPDTEVHVYRTFYLPENADQFDFRQYDYVVDAIDTVTGKIELIMQAKKANVPIISAMGAGNKLDATAFEVADIYRTSVCPLAKVMRRELKKRGVEHLKVVYSKELPRTPLVGEESAQALGRRQLPGSMSYVPSVAGLIIAGEILKDLGDSVRKTEELPEKVQDAEAGDLLTQVDKLHTTELGAARIQKNLALHLVCNKERAWTADEVVEWCKAQILRKDAVITRNGKNWYVELPDCVITVNAHSDTIITAHKKKNTDMR